MGARMTVRSIAGVPVTTRLAMKMEDSLQAFAVRSACFIGELEVPFSEEFDGHDYDATHVIACLGDEPIGAVRVRWFESFAMVQRLAVLKHFRGHYVGWQLLDHCRTLAEGRGCCMLYAQVLPFDTGYWEKQGWRRLVPEARSRAGSNRMVAMVKAVDPGTPDHEVEPPKAIILRRKPQPDATGIPLGACTN